MLGMAIAVELVEKSFATKLIEVNIGQVLDPYLCEPRPLFATEVYRGCRFLTAPIHS